MRDTRVRPQLVPTVRRRLTGRAPVQYRQHPRQQQAEGPDPKDDPKPKTDPAPKDDPKPKPKTDPAPKDDPEPKKDTRSDAEKEADRKAAAEKKRADKAEKDLEDERRKNMDDAQREQADAVKAAEDVARKDERSKIGTRLVDAEIRAAATEAGLKVAELKPLLDHIDRSKLLTDDGDVDEDAVKTLVNSLRSSLTTSKPPVPPRNGRDSARRGRGIAKHLTDDEIARSRSRTAS